MKCTECRGTGYMPSQFTWMLTGICDRCDGTGWVYDDDEFEGDIAPLPDEWEREARRNLGTLTGAYDLAVEYRDGLQG